MDDPATQPATIDCATAPLQREWLETDGLGGFASGRADGTRSRRYHGLLISASRPPAQRVALLQGVEAWLVRGSERLPLSTNVYGGGALHPDARASIVSFRHDPWPRWVLAPAPDLIVTHELFMPRGRSAVVLSWRLVTPQTDCRLEVRPFLSCRDPHALHHENPNFDFDGKVQGTSVTWRPYPGSPALVGMGDGCFAEGRDWYRNFHYVDESDRGFDHGEDLASPGTFHFDLSAGEAALVFGSEGGLEDLRKKRAAVRELIAPWRAAELERREAQSPLERAAEAYVVERGKGSTLIAGYPWFGDWGRDTFIALRGLCLAGERLEDARSILLEWARHVSEGMLPNRFPDAGEAPEYNSVDAALWFVIAVHELRAASQPARGASPSRRAKSARPSPLLSIADERVLSGAVQAILDGTARGTRHGIAVDADGLLCAGEPGVQLTWMDAKVGEHVITPRIGKPVEIQALWLNALWSASRRRPSYRKAFDLGLRSFQARFWNPGTGALFDVVDENHAAGSNDESLRPNQLLAVGGLPLVLLDRERARSVVDSVEQHLWTPMGPRSLDPRDPRYRGRYEGGPLERDSAYHQGTVWPWMAGPFVEAWVRVRGCTNAARREARERFTAPLFAHLAEAGLGHVSEIADGDAPHTPRGCPFQAWSVGELLRLDRAVLAPQAIDGAPCDAAACVESGCKRPKDRRGS